MNTPNHALAAENAAKIIQKADELGRVGGWDTVDYPVAVAYLALSDELNKLRESLIIRHAMEPCWDGDEKLALMTDGSFQEISIDGTHFYPLRGGPSIARKSIRGWISRNALRSALAQQKQEGEE